MAEIVKDIIVNATLEDTWALVGDMEKFSMCIPGCKEVIKKSDVDFDWVIDAKVMRTTRTVKASTTMKEVKAPFYAVFTGDGRLFERSNHYKMQIDGKTELAKLGKNQTRITFSGAVVAKGVGGALIDKIVSSQLDPLFAEFQSNIKTALGDTGEDLVVSEQPAVESKKSSTHIWLWIGAAVAALLIAAAYIL